MRITTPTPNGGMAVQRVAEAAPADAPDAVVAPAAAPMQSSVMQPALQAMHDMPEIDQEKVDMLRNALANGDLPFDPAKLAGLIQRFHGSEK
ncbi:flagellar biosynthesis anti-sigma factor FlgM [Duganella sp. FT94W]|uniref:Negative regulator of flagellin synthesis n=1 Tax=Duganella lactea TaxID=2692173 RepID=A0ABW9V4V3_9BURK|nr:flagellar biosynthesis anti-sigma factor FlgM [Duganella lactea]MYM34724.1 flagellar biosynthesis anti-sigma factor FlgM [Duganella lactea]